MISFWGRPLYSTSWIFYRTSDSKQKGGFFHSKIFQEWLYFWLPFFISSCSTFSLFNTFAPLSKYILLLSFRTNFSKHHFRFPREFVWKPSQKNQPPKTPPRSQWEHRALKRQWSLPRGRSYYLSTRSFCVSWTSGKAVFFLFLNNTQRFCFTKKKPAKNVMFKVFFLLGWATGFLGRWVFAWMLFLKYAKKSEQSIFNHQGWVSLNFKNIDFKLLDPRKLTWQYCIAA